MHTLVGRGSKTSPATPTFKQTSFTSKNRGVIRGIPTHNGTELAAPGITAAGLDFLEDDGGMGAMLRTFTVKIDRDDLRALIAARVEASDLPAEERKNLSHALRSLPEQALRELTTRLVKEAVDRWPDAVRLFQTYANLG